MKKNQRPIHIAIISAMKEEIGDSVQNINNLSIKKYGDLEIYSGKLNSKKFNSVEIYLSIVWSGWGKVSSARAATRIIAHEYQAKKIDFLLFTGVAGSVDSNIKQSDILLPEKVMQYDMNAKPLFERFIIPSLNKSEIMVDKNFHKKAFQAICDSKKKGELDFFGKISDGLIGTGDQFVSEKSLVKDLKKDIPELIAVEMEGAAVAQVAEQERIPWLIVRVISDEADKNAHYTFKEFINLYKDYSWLLIEVLINSLTKELIKE